MCSRGVKKASHGERDSIQEERRRLNDTTGLAEIDKPQLAPSYVRPENEVPQLGVDMEPRITPRDTKSLQPCGFLTDNALLFAFKLFQRDPVKIQFREQCLADKDSRPRSAGRDGVEQIFLQLNYEKHWLFGSIDLVKKQWFARDPLQEAPYLERAREGVRIFLGNENLNEWTEVESQVCRLLVLHF